MVLARVANFFTNGEPTQELVEESRRDVAATMEKVASRAINTAEDMAEGIEDEGRPPYLHAMLAGGLGGLTGDMLMHSLDTVKTRQQGDPHMPPKYTSMGSTYNTIWRQEGFLRGLYGGVQPAFVGSFCGTVCFFGTYEYSKRWMIDNGVAPSLAYFAAGLLGDLAAAPSYVPSEVLKTRLQLQGRYNNPYFNSGYNYRSTTDAVRKIIRQEGFGALFHGYKATLWRDLPFSALQFTFYEKERDLAKDYVGSNNIGLLLEIATAASAGGAAGVITTPLDVVKTRIQTQLPELPEASKYPSKMATPTTSSSKHTSASRATTTHTSHNRPISTSSPSTTLKAHGAATLDTSSVYTGLKIIYKTEGIAGWFRGVGPRFVWTSVQSGTMLVLYQTLLRHFEQHPLMRTDEGL